MADLHFDYDGLVQASLKNVIKSVLQLVAEYGLPGDHHFYITFETGADGVILPSRLRAQYPEHMTIVIQNRFRALKVLDDHFEIELSFNQRPEHLSIPFDSILRFDDPAAGFRLQFHAEPLEDEEMAEDEAGAAALQDEGSEDAGEAPAEAAGSEGKDATGGEPAQAGDKVVALDQFRKKG